MTLLHAAVYIAIAIGILAALVAAMGLTFAAVTFACLAAYALIAGTCAAALQWAFRGQARHDAQALAVVCDPCHGKPGLCSCISKAECGHPLCGADDTGIDDGQFAAGLRQLLDREGPK